MNVDDPTAIQILVAWQPRKWVVSRNTVPIGAYAYRRHAMDAARTVAAQAAALGVCCYLLVRDQSGQWSEHPCPRPRKS